MRRIILLIFTCCISWTAFAQSVFIHHIGVGQGDATLMILKDGTYQMSILIDAGNSSAKGTAVYKEVNKYLGMSKVLNCIIVSHLHSDHMGGMMSLMDSLSTNSWSIGFILDRVAGGYGDSDDSLCYNNASFTWNDGEPALPTSQLVGRYRTAVGKLKYQQWLNFAVGGDVIQAVNSRFSSAISLLCTTSNGYVYAPGKPNNYVYLGDNAHNENDYSYSFLLQMGSFKYFTGGDIGGEAPYVDLETPLVTYFQSRPDATNFHFCSYKASHHGSEHSTNTTFVTAVKPTLTVVPSALRSFSGTQLPGCNTLTRLLTSPATNPQLFYTYIWASNSTRCSGYVDYYQDVDITVDGPTYEQNHTMSVTTTTRDKAMVLYPSTTKTVSVQCQQAH